MADSITRVPRWEKGPNGFVRKANAQLSTIERLVRAPRPPQQVFTPKQKEAVFLARITGLGSKPGYYKATQVLADDNAPANAMVWDGGEGNQSELKLLSGGFGPAINKVVTVKRGVDSSGNLIWYFENDQPFLANITGNAAFGNRFKYAWSEVTFGSDTTASVSGGRSGTTSSGYALNLWETNFTSQYAWAVDMNAEPYASSTMALMPVGGGGTDTTHRIDTPVWMWEVVVADQLAYWFNAPGGHDGGCAEEES